MSRSILLLLALLLTACGNFGLSEEQLMQRARIYMQGSDFRAAAIEIRNILQKNPANAEARFLLANIALDYGDFVSAEHGYRLADKTGWGDGLARVGQLKALLDLEQFQAVIDSFKIDAGYSLSVKADMLALRAAAEASTDEEALANTTLQEAISLDPNAYQVILMKIRMFLEAGELQQASAEAETALNHFPDNAGLLLELTDLSLLQGDVDAAKQLLYDIIGNDHPGYISFYGVIARMSLVELLALEGDYEEAHALLVPLYRRTANAGYVNYLGGLIAFGSGDYDIAEQRLLKVMKTMPDHGPSRLLFATVNYAQQDFEQAAYFLSKYLFLNPDNLDARKLLGRSYMNLDQPGRAREVLKPALDDLAAVATDSELLLLVGFSELRSGESAIGISGMERALAADSRNITLRKELASIYMTTDEISLVIEELQALINRGGNKQAALLIIGSLENGEFERAIDLVLDMLTNNPHDPAVITLVGNVFAASGDYQEARRYLNRALAARPDFPPANLALARLEELQGNESAAIGLYRKLMALKVDSVVPVLALARLEGRQGNTREAIELLRKASEDFPDEIRPQLQLVEHYLRKEQYKEASLLLDEVAQYKTSQQAVMYLRARLLIATDRYERAVTVLTRLLEIDPESTDATVLLAECYLHLGPMQTARNILSDLIRGHPDNAPALALMTKIEIQTDNLDQAMRYSKRLQKEHPTLYLGYMLQGDVWVSKKNYAEAGRYFGLAWEQLPRSELAIRRAEVMLRTDRDAAVKPLLEWLDEHPGDIRVRRFLATTYHTIGNNKQAITEYLKLLETNPNDVAVLNNLAWIYFLGDNPESLTLAKRAYLLDSDNPGVLDTYGWILVHQGQLNKGVKLLKRASKQLPDVADITYHYAVALNMSGKQQQAGKLLEKLLSGHKQFDGREHARQLLEAIQE